MFKKMQEEKSLSPMEQKAKLSVLKGMRDKAGDSMVGGLMSKAAPMSPAPDGLEDGLQEDMEMKKEPEEMSAEELKAHIAELMELCKQKEGSESPMEAEEDDAQGEY